MVRNQASKSSEFKENLEILRHMDFFSGLPLEALKVFAYLCYRETFKPGDYLFHQDDNDGKAYHILSGKAELVREDEHGESVFRDYGDGEFLGGLALVGDMSRLFSLRASTKVECLSMTRDRFTKALEQFPDLIPRVLATIVKRVRSWEERLFIDRDELCDSCRRKVGGVSLI
jgi:CRP-like cAMP-binding protein